MPYELKFIKKLEIEDLGIYYNDCCIGGDYITDYLLPLIEEKYSKIQHDEEDWGFFIWFRHNKDKMAIDVHSDDAAKGEYRIFLSSRIRVKSFWLLRLLSSHGYKVIDTDELKNLKSNIVHRLSDWVDSKITVSVLDEKFNPIE